MKIAKNSKGKFVKILNSVAEEKYYCPVCKDELIRNFGVIKQYFSHQKDKDNQSCELKLGIMLKENPILLDSEEAYILKEEYYDKEFKDIKVDLSDYISDDGYPLTQEQKDIIFAKEDRIKISALAGASKSTTLYYYAKERPYKKILYLVYNKAMKEEAQIQFSHLPHVQILTLHGLAYKHVGVYYKNKLTFNYNAVDVLKDLNLSWEFDQELAVKVYTMFKEYMLSDVESFEELDMFKETEHGKLRPRIIALCEKLWQLKKDYKSNVKIEHDMYLKLFQLSRKSLNNIYDIILVDECQDASKMILDMLINSKVKGIVIVGDPFQALYGWRKAQNILPLFDGKEYKLTTSFRVSQQIANISNLIIQDCSDNIINMKGFNCKQKIVENIDKSKPYVCLCRTNSYIFAEVIDAIENNNKKALYFEGGYQGYNFENIKDAYYFSQGYETRNPLFSKFKDYIQMEQYVEKTDDLELKSLIRMIDNYGARIPKIVETIKYNTVKDKNKADVLFSTIHKSKGMTYKIPVLISDDHFDIDKFFKKRFIDMDRELIIKDFYEEMCILYVSITRCAGEIQLSDIIKKYLITRHEYNLK